MIPVRCRRQRDVSGRKSSNAVMMVPAYLNDSQRQATKDTGTIAGLDMVRIITNLQQLQLHMACTVQRGAQGPIYDMGGSTFEVSLITIARRRNHR